MITEYAAYNSFDFNHEAVIFKVEQLGLIIQLF